MRAVAVVLGERHAMRAADRRDLIHQVDHELPRQRIGADRPGGRAHRRGRARHRDQKHELLPQLQRDVGRDIGLDPARLAGIEEGLRARRNLVVVFAEGKPLRRAGLADHARPRDRHTDIGRAAEQMLAPDDRRQHVVLLHAVLQRDDAGIRSDDGQDWRAAVSVSRSFTEKITMSTLPMVEGSSVAFTFGRCIGWSPSSASPFSRIALRCSPRAIKVTSAPPCCNRAP